MNFSKRLFDLFFSVLILFFAWPFILIGCFLVFLSDFHTPIYSSARIGQFGKPFRLYKIRSMVPRADQSGVTSTASDDMRITKPGRFIRSFKIDELPQFLNVLLGHMSIVGPRPQVPEAVRSYSETEQTLLTIKPGITDFSSIVFSDESDILAGYQDPDLAYDTFIRVPKTSLALFYIQSRTTFLDLRIILITFVSIFNRRLSLRLVANLLIALEAPSNLVSLSLRRSPLGSSLSR